MSIKSVKKLYNYSLLLIVPICIVIVIYILRNAYGPIWLGSNNDPESIHFYNALTLLKHGNIGNVDNPGTTMQLLMAGMTPIIYFFRFTSSPFWEDVILHFDTYIETFFAIIIVINAFYIFLLGKIVFQNTGNIVFAMSLQSIYIILLDVFIYSLSRFGIEILLFTITFPVIIVILKLWFNPIYCESQITFSKHVQIPKYILYLVLICGAGMALKFTFLPIVILSIFLIPRYINKLIFCLMSFIVFAIIIVPIWDKIPYMISWITKISQGSGAYGSDKSFFINPIENKQLIVSLLQNNSIYFVTVFSLFGIVILYLRNNTKIFKFIYRLSLGLLVLFSFAIFIVLKSPGVRYIQPILYLTPLSVLIIYEILKRKQFRSKIVTSSYYILIGFLLIHSVFYLRDFRYRCKGKRDIQLGVYKQLETTYAKKIKIGSYLSSSPASALYLNFALHNFLKNPYLKQRYNRYFYYDKFTQKYLNWDGYTNLETIIRKYGKNNIVFFCSPLEYTPDFYPKVKLKILLNNDIERIYRIQ